MKQSTKPNSTSEKRKAFNSCIVPDCASLQDTQLRKHKLSANSFWSQDSVEDISSTLYGTNPAFDDVSEADEDTSQTQKEWIGGSVSAELSSSMMVTQVPEDDMSHRLTKSTTASNTVDNSVMENSEESPEECIEPNAVNPQSKALENPQEPADVKQLFDAIKNGRVDKCLEVLHNSSFKDINTVSESGLTVLHTAAMRNLPTVVSEILNHPGFTAANARIEGGLTALHCAAFHGNVDVCKLLLKHKNFDSAGEKDDAGWTALDHAQRCGGGKDGPTAQILRSHRVKSGNDQR
jgi:ankyrin repeat protein